MVELKIRLYGDPVLKKKAHAVEKVTQEIKQLVQEMAKLMYQNKGVGLAAPQVGILQRVIVCDVGDGLRALINPRILWRQGKETSSEGCLSIPGVNLEVKRSKEIVVEGLDINGEKVQLGATGLFARALQHEIDHLDGILIIDRVPKKKLQGVKERLDEIRKLSLEEK